MKKTAKQNFEDVISVLKILQVDNQESKIFSKDTVINKEFLYNYFYSKYMDKKEEKNESSEDIIKNAEKKAEEMMLELINNNIIIPGTNGFELGKEVEHIKEVFFGVKKDAAIKRVLSSDETDLKQLFKLCVFKLSAEEIKSGKYEDVVDEKGFIKPSLKILNNDNDNPNIDLLNKIIGLNVNTGTRYYNGKDEYGCFEPGTVDENGNDISGYDVGGYDRYGFNKEGIHKATGQKYNEKYFIKTTDENGNTTFKNIYTDSDLDVFGYNIDGINPKTGFDNGLQQFNGNNAPQHFWHKYDEQTGNFSRLYTEYNLETKKDYYGATKKMKANDSLLSYDFFKNRRHKDTGEYYDYEGLNIDEFDKDGFRAVEVSENGRKVIKYFHRLTSSEYNPSGKDYRGRLEPNFKSGIKILIELFQKRNLLTKEDTKNEVIEGLRNKYENNGITLDDILDKALTIYRIGDFPIDRIKTSKGTDDEVLKALVCIRNCFQNTKGEFDLAIETIRKISPKFTKQIEDNTDYKNKISGKIRVKTHKLEDNIHQNEI